MRVPCHGAITGQPEKDALHAVAERGWYTEGIECAAFERALRDYTGCRDVTLCNSGSSANLLAMETLAAAELGAMAIQPGDEVITTALCFPTTLAPILQIGAVPVFVDVEIPSLLPNPKDILQALSDKTKAVFITHTLGNPFNWRALSEVMGDLWFVEDCCDALGSPGTFQWADVSTLSFFPAHHITTGEGGAMLTRKPALGKIARSLRDWGRDCWCKPGTDNTCGKRFAGGRDHKYTFSRVGYNLKMTDFQGALGRVQMERLPGFVKTRAYNHEILNALMREAGMEDYFVLPPDNAASWFGYALICRENVDRDALTEHLEAHGVQTRRVFGGNILRQPGYQGVEYRAQGLGNTDLIDARGFWIGCWPGLGEDQLRYAVDTIAGYCGGL